MSIKHTKGGFLYDSYGREYKGPYHTDGVFYYAGRVLGNKQFQVYPLEEIRHKRYWINTNFNKVESDRPRFYEPVIEPEDYSTGFIYRYVAQKRNDTVSLIEISSEQYDSYGSDIGINLHLWKVGVFKWYLIGTLEDLLRKNSASIKELKGEFPLITSYFKNLSQYGKNNIE